MGLALREQGLGGLENVSLNCNICAPWCFSEFQLLVQSGRAGRRCAARGGRGFLVSLKTVTESGMRRRCETGREPQVKVVRNCDNGENCTPWCFHQHPSAQSPCLCVLAPSRTLGQQYCPTILIVRQGCGDRKKGSSGVNKRGS